MWSTGSDLKTVFFVVAWCVIFNHVIRCTEISRQGREVIRSTESDNDDGGDGSSSPSQDNEVVGNNGVEHIHQGEEQGDVHRTNHEAQILQESEAEKNREAVEKYRKEHPDAPPPPPDQDFQGDGLNNLNNSTRGRRFVEGSPTKRWPKGIVPYVLNTLPIPSRQKEVKIAMRRIEKYTCIRFVPWEFNVTNTEYGLGHEGHLNFVSSAGCWSYQGNLRKTKGQDISCCGRGTCTHELGHALGMWHEQQSPLIDGWIRINYENIQLDAWKWYRPVDASRVITYGYDISSIMHYASWMFGTNGGKTMTMLSPELFIGNNYFYQFYEMVMSHDCKGLKCSKSKIKCDNDGYLTYINNKCRCFCPTGLNPAKKCKAILKNAKTNSAWPGGNFALMSAVEGCPGTNVFSEGQVTHWSRGGSYESTSFHLKGNFLSESTNIHFCTLNNTASTRKWPEGRYCIHRAGGQCPDGFENGSIQFDDVIRSADKSNNQSGTVPDGVYGNDTLFYFCCRDDGFRSEPMELPNKKPLILYKYVDYNCQEIKGMYSTAEKYVFRNYKDAGHKYSTSGSFPKMNPSSYTYFIYFCYYRPRRMGCGEVVQLNSKNTEATILSPKYPNNYSSDKHCTWLVKAPENSTIILKFNDFELEAGDTCVDTLEVRHARIGQPGIKYCGSGLEQNIHSMYNMISLIFKSNMETNMRGFNITATVVQPEDLCFDLKDRGRTYRGQVSSTRQGLPCLPWAEVKKYNCAYNAFDTRYADEGLDENYCRNPGNGLEPWCYTGYNKQKGCQRGYCDACLKEDRFDRFDDCAELKADGNFCTNDPQAFLGCALTCQSDLPSVPVPDKVIDVTCNAPTIPSDGNMVGTAKSSYEVGETVEIKCNTSSMDVITGTCLTDGSWNIGNYICGVCPTGWALHEGYCYKYVKEAKKYGEAKARCQEFGAIIAPTNSEEDLAYVVSLRTKMRTLWLGATDVEQEGTWVWQDGTNVTWSKWGEKQPDNWRNSEDCAIIANEEKLNVWRDVYCEYYNYHHFVCRKYISDLSSCKDRKDDCQALFQKYPSLCENEPDFAEQDCPFTCNYCYGTVSNCTVPEPNANVTVLTPLTAQTMSQGEYILYECTDGYMLTSGSLERGCQTTGVLTGDPPVCMDEDTIESPNNDVNLISRDKYGSSRTAYTGTSDELIISKTGEITEWQFYSKSVGVVALQVYRPTASETSYTLIGQNIINTKEGRVQHVKVAQGERIQVENGDVIGIFYQGTARGIPYSRCTDSSLQTIRTQYGYSSAASIGTKIGQDVSFSSRSLGCKTFSITAIVGPQQP